MMIHPLSLAVLACDVATAVLLLLAAFSSARIVSGWSPGDPTRRQLRLERAAEATSLQGRFALAAFILGSLILIIAIVGVLPSIVPGAMCGTGVVQATRGMATRALVLRPLALALLAAWRMHDRLNQSAPTSPLGTAPAKLLLLATPITMVAAFDTALALGALDVHTPVHCCAVVYDQVAPAAAGAGRSWMSDTALTWLTLGLGGLLLLTAIWTRLETRQTRITPATLCLTGLALGWVPIAAITLVRVFSAYHYGVLHHHCPWCLFLSEHRWVGFPLLGSLLIVLFDSFGALLAGRIGNVVPGLRSHTRERIRIGALRVVLATLLFGLLAGLPALLWRLQHGVWLTG